MPLNAFVIRPFGVKEVLVTTVRRLVGHELTLEECTKYLGMSACPPSVKLP